MPDLPLHPTLFFSLSIMLGLVLSYFFTLADMIDKKDKKFIIVNLFLYGSWTVAALFAVFIVHLIETNHDRAVAFAPLGMMIAALIASASVMKNIAETKANESEKLNREIFKNKNMLNMLLLNISASLDKYKKIEPGKIYKLDHDIQRLKELYKSLIDKDILSTLDIDNQYLVFEIYTKLINIVTMLSERENFRQVQEREQIDKYITDLSVEIIDNHIDKLYKKNIFKG